MKRMLSAMRLADRDFGLIEDGDHIAVAVSGGKDSMTLLLSMFRYRQYTRKEYDISCINVDLGFPGFDNRPIAEFCAKFDIPFITDRAEAYSWIFGGEPKKHPCSHCANMRRGIVNSLARGHGCNKVALGHHRDDVIETFFLCLFQEARMKTLQPISHLARSGVTIIRPFLYALESDIISVAKKFDLPVIPSGCPVDGKTRREDMNDMIRDIERTAPRARDFIMRALTKPEKYDLWDKYMVTGE